jgi:lysyl-tRNA synthetase class II
MKIGTTLLLLTSLSCTVVSAAYAAEQNIPPNHPKIELPAQTSTHERTVQLAGKVIESMNSGGYSYINLQKKDGSKVWIAVPETKIAVGQQMSFKEGLVMTNFQSKTLKRSFDSIIFSNGIIPQSKTDVPKTPPKDLSVPPVSTSIDPKKKGKVVIGSQTAVASKGKITVTRAKGPNAYTIEEVYKKSAKLNSKKVVVRGRVVKASTGIMKKTWIHIQDGTGSQAKGTHNLVFTTKGTANVGDIITVSGTVAKDRDFGSGYYYKVILEDSFIQVEGAGAGKGR